MTQKQLLQCVRVFARRKPFRPYCIEFFNDQSIVVKHPDAVGSYGEIWVFRSPKRVSVLFTAESVCRLFDSPELAPGMP